jgi:hypothetical protein
MKIADMHNPKPVEFRGEAFDRQVDAVDGGTASGPNGTHD